MPQMAPLNWLALMVYFSIIFMIMNTMNYYLFMPTPFKKFLKKKEMKFNWKW